ncbi:MAG: restriction endonuclease [Sulfuricurvum sp.]|jgi:restriction system protein
MDIKTILIIASIILFFFIKSKFSRYKNQIKELEKKLPPVFSKEEKENMKKYGDEFEMLVGKSYEASGYEVEYRGLKLGYNDQGIDLLARKHGKTVLIQCKYWKKQHSISQSMVKEFYGSCNFYIDNNNLNRDNVVCVYAIAEQKSVSPLAYQLFQKNYIKCRYELFNSPFLVKTYL